jgi:hypothetical protein
MSNRAATKAISTTEVGKDRVEKRPVRQPSRPRRIKESNALPATESAELKADRNGHATTELDKVELLKALLAFRRGDFSARLAPNLGGLDGKIADAFNDIALLSETRARETSRVTHAVGKEGKLKQRMHVPGVTGGWADEVAGKRLLRGVQRVGGPVSSP